MTFSVLLVEDDAIISELVSLGLSSLNCSITQAGDGQDAQRFLAENHYDLTIMDLYLPGMDGITLLKWLREELGVTTPVMILSAAKINEEEARAHGADALIVKPIQLDTLIQTVSKLLKSPTETTI